MPPPGPKFNSLAIDGDVVRDGLVVVVVVVVVLEVMVIELIASVTAEEDMLKEGDGVVRFTSAKDSMMVDSELPATFLALQR